MDSLYYEGVTLKIVASPPGTFVLPTQIPALVARHATVTIDAAKNMVEIC